MNLENFFQRLYDWGVADVIVPFMLVFTIVFAVMQKTEILGKGKRNYNSMIALVMGLSVIFPHVLRMYPEEADPVAIINKALPNVSIILIAILMFLLLIGLLGGEVKWLGTSMSGVIALIAVIAVAFIFGRAAGWFQFGLPNWLSWLDDPDTVAFIVIILVFALLVWWITHDNDAKSGHFFKESFENLGKMFGGGGAK